MDHAPPSTDARRPISPQSDETLHACRSVGVKEFIDNVELISPER